jgi:hypothetical protein
VWGVTGLAALGAAPPDEWRAAQPSLPPVAVAPGDPIMPNRTVATPRTDRALQPAANQAAPLPTTMPTRPAPSATAAPILTAPAMAAPYIPHVPGKIGSQAALGTPSSTYYQTLPAGNTHVYVINGVDPLGWGGLSQMADRIRDSGYPDTKFGGWYEVLRFDRQIRQTHREDPSAQFVIIGYSWGVYRAKALANRLNRDGIPIAMVGYIGGDYLRNTPASLQMGQSRVVNVMGDGYLLTGRNWFFNGTDLAGADNIRMPGIRHFGLPKQDQTFNTLMSGLNASTNRVIATPTDAITTARPNLAPSPYAPPRPPQSQRRAPAPSPRASGGELRAGSTLPP